MASHAPNLWITGLGTQYPAHLFGPDNLEAFAKRFHDLENPGIKRLLKINRSTGIETRSAILPYDVGYANQITPPSIADMDALFRSVGVDLTVQACKKAINDWGGKLSDITHTVAVTCTNQGNPGYDFLVNEKLELSPSVDHTLLHGVGCAGGLAIMRTAAQLACGATMRGHPARILCFACELSTPNVRYELEAAANCVDVTQVSIVGALFSDCTAAFVLCNDLGIQEGTRPEFELLDWGSAVVPHTIDELVSYTESTGYRTVLSRDIPIYVTKAVGSMFSSLLESIRDQVACATLNVADFDWALHPGGKAIIEGVKQVMNLSGEQLRATCEVYKTRGNSSSPTVLAVLDQSRSMRKGRDFVVATSFGPGLTIEMVMLRRCQVKKVGPGL